MQNERAVAPENKSNTNITLDTCIQDAKTLLEQKNFDDFDRIKRIVICLNLAVIKHPEADGYRQIIFKQLITALGYNTCPYAEQSREFLSSQIKNISREKVIKDLRPFFLIQRCYIHIENNQIEEITLFLQLMNLIDRETIQSELEKKELLLFHIDLLNQYLLAHLDFLHNDHQQAFDRYEDIIKKSISSTNSYIKKLCVLAHAKKIIILDFGKNYGYQKLPCIHSDQEYDKARAEEYKKASELDKKADLKLFENFIFRQMKLNTSVVYFQNQKGRVGVLPSKNMYQYAEKFDYVIKQFELLSGEEKNINQQLEECIKLCKKCIALWPEQADGYFVSAMFKLLQYDNQNLKQQSEVLADLHNYEKYAKNDIGNQFISLLAALEDKSIEDNRIVLIRNLNKIFIQQNDEDHVMQFHNCSLVRYVFLRKIFMLCCQLLGRQNMQTPPVWPTEDNYNQLSHYLFTWGGKLKAEKPDIASLLVSVALWNEKTGFIDKRITYQELLPHHHFLSLYYFDHMVSSLENFDVAESKYYLPMMLDKLLSHFVAFASCCAAFQHKKRADFKILLNANGPDSIRRLLLQMDGQKLFNANFNLHHSELESKIINFFVRKFMIACDKKFKQDLTQAEMHYREILPYCKLPACSSSKIEIEAQLKKIEQLKIAKPDISHDLLFNRMLVAFDNNAVDATLSHYLQLVGLVKSVVVNKKSRAMVKLDVMLDQLDPLLEDRHFNEVEEQLKIYFSQFDYSDFNISGRERLLSFLKLYYEKKLFYHAGRLRSLPEVKKEDIISCYQKITIPELKSIATIKIERLLAPPPTVNLTPSLPAEEKKAEILIVEKKPSPKPKKKRSPRLSPAIAAMTVPEEVEDKIEEIAESKLNKSIIRPEKLPLPENVIALLEKLQANAYQGRAYTVGGLNGEILNPVGKKTDIDLVFGACPQSEEERKDPKFALHLLQKTYPNAIVTEKEKRLFKVTFPAQEGQKPLSLDIWWSAPLSNPKLTEEEALKVDAYGGEWASKQEYLKERLTKEDIEETPGRDFTANSLYGNARCQLFDPTGRGYTDLMHIPSRLKCIIRIEESFGKDAVRIIRAILFAAKRNSPISDEMFAKIRALTLGYHLELMSSLLGNDRNKAVGGKIYLSDDGKYVVRDLKGIVQEGSFDINLIKGNLADNLNDKHFLRKILEITSEAGHTLLSLVRLHEEKPYRVNIPLKKLLTQGESARNFELLRMTGLLDKIYPELAHFLNEGKHPLVTKFIYNSLKAIDDLYFYSLRHQEQKQVKNALIWPSLSRIYLILIRATEIMRKCQPSLYYHSYARVLFDSPVIEDAIRKNPFFYEQFMHLGGLVNVRLVDELTKIIEAKDESMLRQLIAEEQSEAERLEINRQINKMGNKEDKQAGERIIKKVSVRFLLEQKRIDKLDFDELIKVRNEQIVVLVERYRMKFTSNIQSVRSDWERNFNHRTELNAPIHNCLLINSIYRQRLMTRLQEPADFSANAAASLHNASLVKNHRLVGR